MVASSLAEAAWHGAHVPDGAGDGTFDPDVMLVVLGLAKLLEFLPEARVRAASSP